jgi:hypothetical protein
MASGTAGRKAEPIWRRQAMAPTSKTARLAQKPRKMPKAVPTEKMSGGYFSAEAFREKTTYTFARS